jgi:hypothetical protein
VFYTVVFKPEITCGSTWLQSVSVASKPLFETFTGKALIQVSKNTPPSVVGKLSMAGGGHVNGNPFQGVLIF